MVRLADLPPAQAQRLAAYDCPNFATEPWVTGPPLSQRRVAIVSSAGLLVRGGMPVRGRFAAATRTTIRYRRAPGRMIC